MKTAFDADKELALARQLLADLASSLPSQLDPATIVTATGSPCRSKAPTIALTFRELQAWRLEEFCRAGLDMLLRGDFAVAVSNIRHGHECCAGTWYLQGLIERQLNSEISYKDAYATFGQLFIGSKNLFEDGPRSINVLTFIKHVEKIIPGFARAYDTLSEIAHPNWSGSAAMFSVRDETTLITQFGRNISRSDSTMKLALNNLNAILQVQGVGYRKITAIMPRFIEDCEKHCK